MINLTLDKSLDIDIKPKSEKEAWSVHLKNKWWRLNNLYFIKDKNGKKVRFRPNVDQEDFLDTAHTRNIVVKCRQRGFTTLMQILELDECMFSSLDGERVINAGTVAQTGNDVVKIFEEKIKFAYNNLNSYIKDKFPAKNDRANELRFQNGSTISVGTSLRSGTYQLLHVSEYGKICRDDPKRAKEIREGTIETVPVDGFICIESTAEGRIGDFYKKSKQAKALQITGGHLGVMDYALHFVAWWQVEEYRLDETPNLTAEDNLYFEELESVIGIKLDIQQKAFYVAKKKDLGDGIYSQYPSTFEEAFKAITEGAYFAKQIAHLREKKRICRIPIDPYIPIDVFWDLGRDTTVAWFFQKVGFDWRFIDYYENDEEGMDFYVNILQNLKDGDRPYNYGDMYLPHDGGRRSMGGNDSAASVLHDNGYQVYLVEKTNSKAASIDQARRVLPQCYFDVDRCSTGLARLEGYRKERDPSTGVWKASPVHDICSHGADAFMTFTDGYALTSEIDEGPDIEAVSASYGRNSTTGY